MSSSSYKFPALIITALVSFAAGSFLTTYLNQPIVEEEKVLDGTSESTKSKPFSRTNQVDSGYFLGVTLNFTSEEVKNNFIELFKPLAEHVEANEPGTMSYRLLESDKTPNRLFIFERYINKDYLSTIHNKSAPFLTFFENFQQLAGKGSATIEFETYNETEYGFI